MASNLNQTATDIVGQLVIDRLREAGYAVVPFNVPDYAVGEVMTWTGCASPDLAWEALNCALNQMAIEIPENAADLTALANRGMTLVEFRAKMKRRAECPPSS